jgi:hypothetical protein
MKSKLLPFAGMFLCLMACGFVRSHATDTKEVPINRGSTRMAISVSTSAWTEIAVSTQVTLAQRSGIKVNNPSGSVASGSGNNKSFNCTLESTTPTIQIGTGEIEIGVGENPFIPTQNLRLFCVSLYTSAETAYAREIGQ